MCLAVVGGLVVSQLLTLFITPVYYGYMERFAGSGKKRKDRKAQALPNNTHVSSRSAVRPQILPQ